MATVGRSALMELDAAPKGGSTTRRFDQIADRATRALGSPPALAASVALVVGWALTGPVFAFSDTWQLFINTTTTVITFWMVFVIQNSANRESKATQLKLDELISRRIELDANRDDTVPLEKGGGRLSEHRCAHRGRDIVRREPQPLRVDLADRQS
jgi:low affinity Fe/Cu permease